MHFPKPFFKTNRGVWYVEINRHQHNLGPDKDAAFDQYHKLMGKRPEKLADDSVITICKKFLNWVADNRDPATHQWYERHLDHFVNDIPAGLRVCQLAPKHVTAALKKHPGWSNTNKNGYCRAVARAFQWADDEGEIDRTPLRKLKKPRANRRKVVIEPETYQKMLADTKDQVFKDVLTTMWEVGCRAEELLAVEAHQVDAELQAWVFEMEAAKGEKTSRMVCLTPTALEISLRLAKRWPAGPIFRNKDGNSWTPFSVSCRFRKFKRKLGERYCLTNFRHSWCHRALKSGLDPITVSVLMGHKDVAMIANVYSHLAHDTKHLREKARQVR